MNRTKPSAFVTSATRGEQNLFARGHDPRRAGSPDSRSHEFTIQLRECDVAKTGGHYHKTVEQLKNLVEQAWKFAEEDEKEADAQEDVYTY